MSTIAVLAVLAFAVRAAVAVQLGRTPLFERPQLDSWEFLLWAQSIARGEVFRWLAASHGPGYPYFLGGLLALFGGSVGAARIAQAALGAGLCVLTAALGARLFADRRAGLAAGLLLALYGPLVYVEVSLLAEGLFVFLLTLALWLLTRPRYAAWAAAVAGLALGLAAVVRGTALPLGPVLAAVLLVRRPAESRWPRISAVWLAAAWLVVVAPVLVLVRQTSHGWLPMQSFGGLNLYMGNRIGSDGTPSARLGGDWDLLVSEPARQGITVDADRERYFTRKALREIAAQPLGFVGRVANKTFWLLQADEIRESHSLYFFRQFSPVLRVLPGFGLLLPLAAWGLWLARRRLPLELIVYLLVMTASCVLIIVSSRYRLPLVPVLAALGGGAAVWLFDEARARRWRELAPAAAVLIAAVIVSHLRTHAPSHDLAEEWSMTAASLQTLGRSDEARQAVDRALAEDPGSALAWVQDGRLRLEAQDAAGAEKSFATAARLAPNYQRARLDLGMAYKQRGDLDGALRELREAARLSPDDPAALSELGQVLLAKGEVEEARTALRRATEIAPDDPAAAPAWLALARIEGAARNPKAGVELASRAARLEPESPEAWMVLGMLALDAQDAAVAEDALRHAESLSPGAPAVGLGQALLARMRGDHEGADRLLRELLQRYPGFQPAAQLLMANAAEQGRQAEAESFLRSLPAAPPPG
jgi:Flp pilus assembly protein TadD/4-amino-4-deoxy-L-arabinose transferase-like glycosyltransferase